MSEVNLSNLRLLFNWTIVILYHKSVKRLLIKRTFEEKNTYHIIFVRGKKQENKLIPIWSLYHPQWIQGIIALDNTGNTRGRFQTPCRSASEGPGPGSFSGEQHDWTPSPICHAKTMRLHQATRHLCNYDRSMCTPLSVRSSHDLYRVSGQVGLATKHQTIGLPMASQILPLLNMGQKSSHTWDVEHLVSGTRQSPNNQFFSGLKNGDIFSSIFLY